MRPIFEQLEARDLPAVSFAGGLVVATPDGKGDHSISADTVAGAYQITIDGQVAFSAPSASVTRTVLLGSQRGGNVIQNNTQVPTTLIGGPQRDTLFSGPGMGDVVLPGAGADVVYSIVGSHRVVTAGGGADRVFSNPNNSLLSGPEDRVVTFFANGRTPGSGRAELDGGTIFLTPPNGGSSVSIDRVGPNVVVTTSWAGTLTFARSQVRDIAYFGGSGSDVYQNNTDLPEASYGAGGDDTLLSGFGAFSLLKGSGGNDTLVGRARRNDLSGNGGADVLIALSGQGDNVFRADQADLVFGQTRGDQGLFS